MTQGGSPQGPIRGVVRRPPDPGWARRAKPRDGSKPHVGFGNPVVSGVWSPGSLRRSVTPSSGSVRSPKTSPGGPASAPAAGVTINSTLRPGVERPLCIESSTARRPAAYHAVRIILPRQAPDASCSSAAALLLLAPFLHHSGGAAELLLCSGAVLYCYALILCSEASLGCALEFSLG